MLSKTVEIPRPWAGQTPSCTKSPAAAAATLTAPVPQGLAFTERAAAGLREYLARVGLHSYRVFYNDWTDADLHDVDEHLEVLGEGAAAWEPLPGLFGTPAGVASVRLDHDGARHRESGCIHLRNHEVVLARWFWVNLDRYDSLFDVWLCAAPTADHYTRLRDAVRRHRHSRAAAEWRIVSDDSAGERVPRRNGRSPTADDLVLTDRLRGRIDVEIVRFFGEEAAGLYASLHVPYRRGVLLHGPPGNGKTSLIRLIGSRLPRVPGFILRPGAGFDADDLTAVIRRWTTHAPAILVIEDLDWLLKTVEVSTFLNLIDGIESSATGGLLLMATTNHPEKLDPAVNNRPGRFDVVIEVPSPDEPLRLAYLRRHLGDCSTDTVLQQVAVEADGLAFAHLQEILRLSGLLAINAGRAARSDEDVLAASKSVRESYENAVRGFPSPLEMPFGLVHLHRGRQGQGQG